MKTKPRALSLLLSATLLLTAAPQTVFATSSVTKGGSGLCKHHPVHDEDCGYTEGTPKTSCSCVRW